MRDLDEINKMDENKVLSKIKSKPQTRYTLCNCATDFVKLNRIVKRLIKRNLITKRYYHVDNTKQVVYVPFNFSGFLINYLMDDLDLNKTYKKEYLFYFDDYINDNFTFKIKHLYVLDSNVWLYLGTCYIDKHNIRCF